MAAYSIRTMTLSEHSDNSWEDSFGVSDEERRIYCVVNELDRIIQELESV